MVTDDEVEKVAPSDEQKLADQNEMNKLTRTFDTSLPGYETMMMDETECNEDGVEAVHKSVSKKDSSMKRAKTPTGLFNSAINKSESEIMIIDDDEAPKKSILKEHHHQLPPPPPHTLLGVTNAFQKSAPDAQTKSSSSQSPRLGEMATKLTDATAASRPLSLMNIKTLDVEKSANPSQSDLHGQDEDIIELEMAIQELSRQQKPANDNFRYIIIDGSNVAMQ